MCSVSVESLMLEWFSFGRIMLRCFGSVRFMKFFGICNECCAWNFRELFIFRFVAR